MTEAEWLTSNDPLALSEFLTERRVSERKARWFGAACCRLLERWAPEWPQAVQISLLEDIADGRKDRSLAPERVMSVWGEPGEYRTHAGLQPWSIQDGVLQASFTPFPEPTVGSVFEGDVEFVSPQLQPLGLRGVVDYMRLAFRLRLIGEGGWEETLIPLLRDIFGKPFRLPGFHREWRTDTAVAIARQMFAARDFSAMPVLADALQDAGCDNDDLLRHCRQPGEHVRGCWAVDLVLGNE